MTGLPYLRREDLDEDRRRLWDAMVGSRGSGLVTEDGGLLGPFNAWLHAPVVGRPAVDLGTAVRFQTSLERSLSELAIITVGARWKAEFEWWAHSRMAVRHGVPESAVEAIAAGEEPVLATDKERIVYNVAHHLAHEGTVPGELLASCRKHLGDTGTAELVTTCGYYTLVSFVLNAFDVPLPEGELPRWR